MRHECMIWQLEALLCLPDRVDWTVHPLLAAMTFILLHNTALTVAQAIRRPEQGAAPYPLLQVLTSSRLFVT